MVLPGRIELPIQSYQDCVMPFNYGSILCVYLLINGLADPRSELAAAEMMITLVEI